MDLAFCLEQHIFLLLVPPPESSITRFSMLDEFFVTWLSVLAEFCVTRLSVLAKFSITQLFVLVTRLEPPIFSSVLPTRLFWLTRSACRSVLLSWITRLTQLGLPEFSPLFVTFAAPPVNLE
jgi:hypothetical protein